MKYPGEIKDSHPTKEGCKFVAETLYKAIISKQKNNLKKSIIIW